MVEDNIDLGAQLSRASQPLRVSSSAAICGSFALFEGGIASIIVMLSAVTYHMGVMQVPGEQVDLHFYAGYSALVGLCYGVFSAVSASRFLNRSQHQHAILADSALGWTAAFAMALLLAFLVGVIGDLSRVSLTSAYLVGLPVLLGARNLLHSGVSASLRAGKLHYRKVAVIGTRGDVAQFLHNGNLGQSGYELAGTLHLEDVRDASGSIMPGAIVEFAQRGLVRGVENVLLVGELGDIDALERLAGELKRFSVNVISAPATANTSFKFLDVVQIGPNNGLRFLRKPMSDGAVLLKRMSDLAGASLGLLVLSPLFLAVALLIKLESPGPVFYRQERRGFNGQSFFIWKFRSMTVTESGDRMVQAMRGDKRITGIGRFIRATSIDELPQLINVLAGEMSLVGPRPHAIVHDDELGEQLASYAHRQRIKPGITGWAQVNGFRGETATFAQIEGRTLHDLHYIDNWSIFLDCWIIVLTIFSPKTRRNAF